MAAGVNWTRLLGGVRADWGSGATMKGARCCCEGCKLVVGYVAVERCRDHQKSDKLNSLGDWHFG